MARKLVLSNGEEYPGTAFGSLEINGIYELVFNTSMTGYQEILSDPSYTDQAVVMSYPLIGNYGINPEDFESAIMGPGVMIVRDYNDCPSHYKSTETLSAVMARFGVCGVTGTDTRKLVRAVRDAGSMPVMLTSPETKTGEALARLRAFEPKHDAVSRVSGKRIREYIVKDEKHHIVAIDCGMKQNIVRSFTEAGISVTVVPWNTAASEILSFRPEGIFISNGPGDPDDCPAVKETVKKLIGQCPVFGICLGHQILSLAYGAKTYKLKFGHRGGNHPVKALAGGKIEITSQNHSYAVSAESVRNTPLEITHINILDHTVEGVCCEADRAFGVQYHPEAAPGPHDGGYLFQRFIEMMAND
ncbi:MAG: glutamine-hydrolyzing carbamoyl-phosphate synthase small subunit [Lachnospiraceae bacterium]|nr:glutamine-hydrolyzing carbamoyl-phosphate synthase small subunit [Lachnospiraceae bacterium]